MNLYSIEEKEESNTSLKRILINIKLSVLYLCWLEIKPILTEPKNVNVHYRTKYNNKNDNYRIESRHKDLQRECKIRVLV